VYSAANTIFGKVDRHASKEVILQLISSKCMPVLLYGLEVCPLNKTAVNSLDVVINSFFLKLFKTIILTMQRIAGRNLRLSCHALF